MNNQNLIRYVTALADDSLIFGQRLSELCSNAPYLEEDLAISNVALDYIGRASLWYQYAAKLTGGDCTEDSLAFFRDERQYTNLLISELPNGDFAFTLMKQYLIDSFYQLYLVELAKSSDQNIAAIAAKAIKETNYHIKRSAPWIKQLAMGTDESLNRLKLAIEELCDYANELFLMPEFEEQLLAEGIAVDRTALKQQWLDNVNSYFSEIGLESIDLSRTIQGGREGIHTEHLGHMLSEMQFMQRAYPGLEW